MEEDANIGYMESWGDECLKWACGFANALGGTLYIGVDDDGNVVGVADAEKLLEDIPRVIRTELGIDVDVNKYTENGNDYLEIVVPVSSFPVTLRGIFHYRQTRPSDFDY